MIKLTEQSDLNSPDAYDAIYAERDKKQPDEMDMRRWKKLLRYYKGSRLIDLGCLDSRVPQLALQRFPEAEIWGIDLAREAIKDMQKKFSEVYFEVGDVYATKYPSNYFGYAVAGEIMEHLDDPEKFLAEAFRILRPGGTLALSVPKEEATEPGAIDPDRHIWSYSEEDIKSMLTIYGTVNIETLGSKYFPVYKYAFPNLLAFCKKK